MYTNEDTNLFLFDWAMPVRLNNGNVDCSDIVIDPGLTSESQQLTICDIFCKRNILYDCFSLSCIRLKWSNYWSYLYINLTYMWLNGSGKREVDALLYETRRRRSSNWNFSPKPPCHHSLRLAPVFCRIQDLICPAILLLPRSLNAFPLTEASLQSSCPLLLPMFDSLKKPLQLYLFDPI